MEGWEGSQSQRSLFLVPLPGPSEQRSQARWEACPTWNVPLQQCGIELYEAVLLNGGDASSL